jgi:exodeoxyribonuclease VII large subunit
MSLFDALEVAEEVDPTWTISGLNAAIAGSIRETFGDEVWVRGEVRSISRPSSGHIYLELTERSDGSESTLRVSLFRGVRTRVEAIMARVNMELAEGLEIRICGQVDYYAPRGQISLKMTGIDPTYTLGRLAADRDALIRRLVAAGLTERNRTRVLPLVPLRVGLVTSIGSAAYHDFTDELVRSGIAFHVLVADARVQGSEAPQQIAEAINMLIAADTELICLVRGGGSRTDLAAWDTEMVALAIAACPVPVWTGVGHDIDASVADLMAHQEFKTPTACAQAIIGRVAMFMAQVDGAAATIARQAQRVVDDAVDRLVVVGERLPALARRAVESADQRAQQHARRVSTASLAAVTVADLHVNAAATSVARSARHHLDNAERRMTHLEALIGANDPARLLERGWSITTDANGNVVRSVHEVVANETLHTRVSDGTITSTVNQ